MMPRLLYSVGVASIVRHIFMPGLGHCTLYNLPTYEVRRLFVFKLIEDPWLISWDQVKEESAAPVGPSIDRETSPSPLPSGLPLPHRG
jgi:hypothetical protein